MKCFLKLSTILLLMLFPAIMANAQTFQQCGDVNQSGSVSISDMAYMMNYYIGGPAMPAGRGDVDFRQNFNLGDLCYITGYLFLAYPEGGCPPFPYYTLANTTDTVFLPEAIVPPGGGTILLPIVVSNTEVISHLLITSTLTATNCDASINYVTFTNWVSNQHHRQINGNELALIWASLGPSDQLQPGNRTVAVVEINYSASTGGTVSLNPAFLGDRFTHEVYGPLQSENYNLMNIGLPHVAVRAASAVPTMSVVPDSLYFVILSGSGNPAPQTFDVLTDGSNFDWSATAPSWINLAPTFGVAGANVSVQPLTYGLAPGTHVGTVVVSSGQAMNSPKNVKVVLRIQPQYPSFDANCDGTFNVSDVVVLALYIFGGPAPCDPCGL